jgi:L-rhamnose mutarotase
VKRYGSVVRLRPEKEAEYRRLHAAVWPAVLEQIRRSNIRNYSIFLRDGVLFSYFEYVGEDYESDLRAMAADEQTQQWWALTDPCQERVPGAPEGAHWAPLEEVFHSD